MQYNEDIMEQDKINAIQTGQQLCQPRGPCFNCRNMGHFARDCRKGRDIKVNFMDTYVLRLWTAYGSATVRKRPRTYLGIPLC